MCDDILIKPIGFIRSELKYRYETSRQGVLSDDHVSVIELLPRNNFEQALQQLDGFERIWVIFQFHLNTNWKPMVTPPRHTRKKIGVFATRAPYRPNQIGLSCVKLIKIDGLQLIIGESDILDGSPVFDIKPYLPYSDSFPDAKTGWVKKGIEDIYEVTFEQKAVAQMAWLQENAQINLRSFARLQLEFNPADDSRKRVSKAGGEQQENRFVLAYRTWRIYYTVDDDSRNITITEIRSGYSAAELADVENDVYADKGLHLKYQSQKF